MKNYYIQSLTDITQSMKTFMLMLCAFFALMGYYQMHAQEQSHPIFDNGTTSEVIYSLASDFYNQSEWAESLECIEVGLRNAKEGSIVWHEMMLLKSRNLRNMEQFHKSLLTLIGVISDESCPLDVRKEANVDYVYLIKAMDHDEVIAILNVHNEWFGEKCDSQVALLNLD